MGIIALRLTVDIAWTPVFVIRRHTAERIAEPSDAQKGIM